MEASKILNRFWFLYPISVVLILFAYSLNITPISLLDNPFLNWDAEHYYWIKNNGYEDFRVAFFPLFPLVWKMTNLSIFGMAAVNAIIYLYSLGLLFKHFEFDGWNKLLVLSIPSSIFFYLPYSESLFFFSSTLLIIGIFKKEYKVLLLGLFLCTICRPSITVLVPALILMEILISQSKIESIKMIGLYLCVSLLGLVLVAFMQYHYTGEWFNFLDVQKGWGNEFGLPKLPLTTWGGDFNVRMDAIAFLFGTVCGVYVLYQIWQKAKGRKLKINRTEVLSLLFVGGINLFVLLFRGGSLFSLNRFVFAAPFAIIIWHYWINSHYLFSLKKLVWIFLAITVFWLAFGSYGHIRTFLNFEMIGIYSLLLFAVKSDNLFIQKWSLRVLVGMNVFFQGVLMIRFLSGEWVG